MDEKEVVEKVEEEIKEIPKDHNELIAELFDRVYKLENPEKK